LVLCQLRQEDSTESWWPLTSSLSGSKSNRSPAQRLVEYSTYWMSLCIATGYLTASSKTWVPTSITTCFGSTVRTTGLTSGTFQLPIPAPTGWYATPSRSDCMMQLTPKEENGSRNYPTHTWGLRTQPNKLTGQSPYFLVYGSIGHTPRVPQGMMKTDSYKNSPVILLGLVPCNPTRTPTL
jgi:hypothetical protein